MDSGWSRILTGELRVDLPSTADGAILTACCLHIRGGQLSSVASHHTTRAHWRRNGPIIVEEFQARYSNDRTLTIIKE